MLSMGAEPLEDLLAGGRSLQTWDEQSLGISLVYLLCSLGLVCLAGCMSGLTLGLLSLDTVEVEVLLRSGTAKEKHDAAAIFPLIRRPHMLLVTLLLCNAAAMETLPILLDRLVDPVIAIIISVTAVLFFGEIIPQALCARYGLAIGANLHWFVRFLMVLTFPVSWPIAKLLDCLLGSEQNTLFRRRQLKALVDLHGADEGLGGNLTVHEVNVITGALDLTNKIAMQAMTPLKKTFMLSIDDTLDDASIQAILRSGHSRIPVHEGSDRHSIVGLLLVKELLQTVMEHRHALGVPVADLRLRTLPRLTATTPMYEVLTLFQGGRSHMAVLTQPEPQEMEQFRIAQLEESQRPSQQHDPSVKPGEPIGIITIEDVLETLLQTEILDETDQFVDNDQLIKVQHRHGDGSGFVGDTPITRSRKSSRLRITKLDNGQTTFTLEHADSGNLAHPATRITLNGAATALSLVNAANIPPGGGPNAVVGGANGTSAAVGGASEPTLVAVPAPALAQAKAAGGGLQRSLLGSAPAHLDSLADGASPSHPAPAAAAATAGGAGLRKTLGQQLHLLALGGANPYSRQSGSNPGNGPILGAPSPSGGYACDGGGSRASSPGRSHDQMRELQNSPALSSSMVSDPLQAAPDPLITATAVAGGSSSQVQHDGTVGPTKNEGSVVIRMVDGAPISRTESRKAVAAALSLVGARSLTAEGAGRL